MSTTSGPSRATRVRATMALSKPHSKHQVSLSFDAALSLAYGLRAIGTASTQRPHESSIARRALELYGNFLSAMTREQLHTEARAVAASSKAFGLPADEQKEAFERLNAVAGGVPLPGLLEVRNGLFWTPDNATSPDAKVDEMVREGYCSVRQEVHRAGRAIHPQEVLTP